MKMIIDGKFVDSVSGVTYPVYNPYTGEVIDQVPKANIEDVKKAIEAADKAKNVMRNLDFEERIGILTEASRIMKRSKNEFIDILVSEAGQPIKHANWEVERTYKTLENSLLHAKELYGEQIPSYFSDKFIFTIREPVGLISTLLPLNAPLALPSIIMTHSLVAGNSIVLKAASETPISSLKFGEVLLAADLPKGVFNVITGSGKELGGELIQNPKVNMVAAFTGVDVAKAIATQAGGALKKTLLELPGKNPFIVLEDCNLERAVDACAYGAYVNSGQICMAVEVVMVHKNVIDEFTERLVEKTKKLKTGDPADSRTDIGPLPSKALLEVVDKQVKDAVSDGAKILTGGKYQDLVYEPTVLIDVTPDMEIARERTSGPIAPIIKISDLKEAVNISNNLKLGLRASVFTNNLEDAFYAVRHLQFGGIMINGTTFYMEHHFPWGGLKDSGVEGVAYLIEKLTNKKLVTIHDIF